MRNAVPDPAEDKALAELAARWTVRRDRGLSAAESIEFELWLAADPRHSAAMARADGTWMRLDRVPDELAQEILDDSRRRRRGWRLVATMLPLAAAAAWAFTLLPADRVTPAGVTTHLSPAALQAAGPRLVALADGTEVRLNAGSGIVERFTASERGVELTQGEAHFSVTKDPARPFVVSAGGLRVRAIGTAFNVSRLAHRTEVLVTEGRVALLTQATVRTPETGSPPAETTVTASGPTPAPAGQLAELAAGERAVVTGPLPGSDLISPEIKVARVEAAEISRALAWQENLLRLGGATLAEIAAEFERRTGHRVMLADPALAQVRLGGRFRADDAEGFAKLLTAMLDVDVERGADGTLVLREKK
jgi:transmembrane sensor